MTIEQQLQKVIHETNILREMISLFSGWNNIDTEWVLYNIDRSVEWLVALQESMRGEADE